MREGKPGASITTVAKSATERALSPWSTPTVKIVNFSAATQTNPLLRNPVQSETEFYTIAMLS